jgi:hypothetical protein
MTIILLVWWSLARGNHVVPSRWQATGCRALPGNKQRRTNEGSAARPPASVTTFQPANVR